MATNLSHDDIRRLLSDAIHEKHGGGKAEKGCCMPSSCYVQDVFPEHVVYQDGKSEKLMRQGYAIVDGAATLVGEPEEVARVTSYEPVDKQGPSALEKITGKSRGK